MFEDAVNGYPILLRLAGQRCAVVGGGRVGERKVLDLLVAGAQVTILSPALTPALTDLAARGAIQVNLGEYSPGVLSALRPRLVFAATNSGEINRQIAQEAREMGILVDVVDSADSGDFTSMAALHRGPVTLAVSTGGASPTLAAHLRERLASTIGPEYGTLASWLAELRPLARAQIRSERSRRSLWRAILESPALELLRQGDEATAHALIHNLYQEAANKRQRE
jgi:precorrin-2 dehydrogenase/sirohydrochlorin ferrochelatase